MNKDVKRKYKTSRIGYVWIQPKERNQQQLYGQNTNRFATNEIFGVWA